MGVARSPRNPQLRAKLREEGTRFFDGMTFQFRETNAPFQSGNADEIKIYGPENEIHYMFTDRSTPWSSLKWRLEAWRLRFM